MTRIPTAPDRIVATYQIAGDENHVLARARDICVEQTVEFPADLVTDPFIAGHILGRIEGHRAITPDRYEVAVGFALEVTGGELPQLLNVLFGNISLKPGIRLRRIELPAEATRHWPGPRFGVAGLRELLGVRDRPLVATALKPMGRSADQLADLAYRLARGGLDLVKDDHGLTDQPFCRFADRVGRCAAAVDRANREIGGHCRYFANVTASADQVLPRARAARDAGAGGLLCAPALIGFDAMRSLAEADLGLPILAHPALLGAYTASPDSGIAHRVIYGELMRIAGADGSIFPSYGGRFAFTAEQCRDLAAGCAEPLASLRPIFPIPAGGMRVDRIPELCRFYGRDAVLLIGGDLHRRGDVTTAARDLVTRVIDGHGR